MNYSFLFLKLKLTDGRQISTFLNSLKFNIKANQTVTNSIRMLIIYPSNWNHLHCASWASTLQYNNNQNSTGTFEQLADLPSLEDFLAENFAFQCDSCGLCVKNLPRSTKFMETYPVSTDGIRGCE